MKKNKMMRIASILMVATLITTCAISGTFAKYVTKASGEGQARVAKWGIVLTMEGDKLFSNVYKAHDTTFTGSENVQKDEAGNVASVYTESDKLVAPGTHSSDIEDGGFKATVKGTPEVATRYTLSIPAGWTDIVLPAGTYTDYTQLVADEDGKLGYNGTFTLEKDYAPVKWDIKVSKGSTSMSLTEVAATKPALAAAMGGDKYGFSATDAKTIVETYADALEELILTMVSGASNPVFEVTDNGDINLSMDFDAGKDMDFTFELAWAWAYDTKEAGVEIAGTSSVDAELTDVRDMADTYLGNAIADALVKNNVANATSDTKLSTEINFTFVATATQID